MLYTVSVEFEEIEAKDAEEAEAVVKEALRCADDGHDLGPASGRWRIVDSEASW